MTTDRELIMGRLYAMSSTAPAPRPTPAMRDCVRCGFPFFSRSAGNVVCPICRSEAVQQKVDLP